MPAIIGGKIYYTTAELSRITGLSKEWINTLLRRWKVPVIIVGPRGLKLIPEKYAKKIAYLYGVKL